MPKSFQWITLLLTESIYFVGTRVKGPHTSIWIIPSNSIGPLGSTSKFQIYQTSRKHVQNSNPRTSGKHVQNSIPLNLWEERPKFNFNGPLGSTSKIQFHQTFGKHIQNSNPWTSRKHLQIQIYRTSGKHVQNSNPWTSGKHVQNSRSLVLWKARLKSSFCCDH